MKIRVLAQHREGFAGFHRGGRFWSSQASTTVDVSEAELATLRSDARLIIETVVEEPAAEPPPAGPPAPKGKG